MPMKEPKLEKADASVKEVVRKVLTFHELEQVNGARVEYLFSLKAMKAKGRRLYAKIVLSPELHSLIHGIEAMVIIDKELWETLDGNRREAVIFHELCHLESDGEGGLSLRSHDLEEFRAVVRRYGDWTGDVRGMTEQLCLFDGQIEGSEVAQFAETQA